MAYAIIQSGGKQFRVAEGDVIRLPLLGEEPESSVVFDVLLYGDGDQIEIGDPVVKGRRVTASVLDHGRATKIIVFKKKRRKGYKKTQGHRQDFTEVRIESIESYSKKSR